MQTVGPWQLIDVICNAPRSTTPYVSAATDACILCGHQACVPPGRCWSSHRTCSPAVRCTARTRRSECSLQPTSRKNIHDARRVTLGSARGRGSARRGKKKNFAAAENEKHSLTDARVGLAVVPVVAEAGARVGADRVAGDTGLRQGAPAAAGNLAARPAVGNAGAHTSARFRARIDGRQGNLVVARLLRLGGVVVRHNLGRGRARGGEQAVFEKKNPK